MPVERAVRAFQHERKSCAESILHAFREHRPLTDEEWQDVAAGGHGRGEGGLCGALSAALQLAPGDPQRDAESGVDVSADRDSDLGTDRDIDESTGAWAPRATRKVA